MKANSIATFFGILSVGSLWGAVVKATPQATSPDLVVAGNLDVSGNADIRGNFLNIGSWASDSTKPGAAFGYSDPKSAGSPSVLSLTGNSALYEWHWDRASDDLTGTVPMMRLDSNNRLLLFSPSDPVNPVIVLDPAQGKILINGAELGSSFAAIPNTELSLQSDSLIVSPLSATGQNAHDFGTSCTASGVNATTMGVSTQATNTNATAMGESTCASGYATFAIGQSSTASGLGCVAMGHGTIANQDWAFAAGVNTTASGWGSFAIGNACGAAGPRSFAGGDSSHAYGDCSFVVGRTSNASGGFSAVFGESSTASGPWSFATGYYSFAGGDASTAMGRYVNARGLAQTAVGQFNVIAGTSNAWISSPNEPVFIVGNGVDEQHRSNAFSVAKNGDASISGKANIGGGMDVTGTANLQNAVITGAVTVNGGAQMSGLLVISGSGALALPDGTVLSSSNTLPNLIQSLSLTGSTGTISASQVRGLAAVATTGDYNSLTGVPTIPNDNTQIGNGRGFITSTGTAQTISGSISAAQVAGLSPVATAGSFASLQATPTTLAGYGISDPILLATGSYSDPAWIASLSYLKISGAPTKLSQLDNDSGYLASSGTVSNVSLSGSTKITGGTTFSGGVVVTGTLDTASNTVVASGTDRLVLIPQQGDLTMGSFNAGPKPQ